VNEATRSLHRSGPDRAERQRSFAHHNSNAHASVKRSDA
jgi:hypothetical protein